MLVCVWYLITCYLQLALCMHDSKMMETSPACKNTHRQHKSLKWKNRADAFIWAWINVCYNVRSVFTEHSLEILGHKTLREAF